jgi:hypothetical protein
MLLATNIYEYSNRNRIDNIASNFRMVLLETGTVANEMSQKVNPINHVYYIYIYK